MKKINILLFSIFILTKANSLLAEENAFPLGYVITQGTKEAYLTKISRDEIQSIPLPGGQILFGGNEDKLFTISSEVKAWQISNFKELNQFKLSAKPVTFLGPPVNGIVYRPEENAFYIVILTKYERQGEVIEYALGSFNAENGKLVKKYPLEKSLNNHLTGSPNGMLIYGGKTCHFFAFKDDHFQTFTLLPNESEPIKAITPEDDELYRKVAPQIFFVQGKEYIRVNPTEIVRFELPDAGQKQAITKVIYSASSRLLKPKIVKLENVPWLFFGLAKTKAANDRAFEKIIGINLQDDSLIKEISLSKTLFDFSFAQNNPDKILCLTEGNSISLFNINKETFTTLGQLDKEIYAIPSLATFFRPSNE